MFAAAGQEYEDVRIEREQWPTEFKPKMPTGLNKWIIIYSKWIE